MSRPRRAAPEAPLARSKRISLEAAADRYGVSVDTLRRRITDGSLPAYRMGARLIRVEEADVAALFQPVQSVGGAR
ncbi:excisionase family DNA-binding protein [Ornithinimicrobium tianjinense]|uniref:Helix-turn-helix domain-containing protein n=1 Tax=Ornithinimicrobium tianjinense TaxID=1195761 RepID=A0A917BK07_9MICO|nr:excisionase family DNA-binding protein [Ornithinimicrobium tianjinense]GGF46582.1 hypothetical protein GCM10011366_12860 [Ornithinimicrobium tianjinense]